MTPPHDVLIAAGGTGSRLYGSADSRGLPKCLWPFSDGTLLSSLLSELAQLGLSVLVSTNRPSFRSVMEDVCESTNTALVFDPGFATTIDLARMHHKLMKPEFLFLYGHTWMPSEKLSPFCEAGEAVGLFETSSRRDPLAIRQRFAEPPFRVNSNHLVQSDAPSWRQYWKESTQPHRLVDIDGPSEANTLMEMRAYERSWRRRLAA